LIELTANPSRVVQFVHQVTDAIEQAIRKV
jgi:hypothetical protein